MPSVVEVRRAVREDAGGIVAVLRVISSERTHSAIDEVWKVDDQERYISALSSREAIHVATNEAGCIVGLQILDRWAATLNSTAHVGQLGTFLLPEWRRRGVGRHLWEATLSFAREARYRKLVIQVRGSNTTAQAFYRALGFNDCGRLARQVVIDGVEDDEVLMELFL
jgi:ribosomal protein S18 acetylase RimI-like enzyme